MSDLVRLNGSRLPTRLERTTARALDRVRADQALAAARHTAKLDVIADVTQAALLATSHVSAMEALLVSRTPHAEARLRHIADAGTLGMAAVVMKASRTIP
jgi:hypothetical protein